MSASDNSTLSANVLGQQLLDRATRLPTLDVLESHTTPIPDALALAAAPALLDLLMMDASEVNRTTFDRVGLMLGRLVAEAPQNVARIYGAAFRDQGLERLWNSDNVLNTALLSKPALELSEADAISYACAWAHYSPTVVRTWNAPFDAAGITGKEWLKCVQTIIDCTSCCSILLRCHQHILLNRD
jgi:hypothetical protein